MKTLKRLWKKFTAKIKSIKDRFIEIIQNRLNNTNPESKWDLFLLGAASVFSMAAVILGFTLVPSQLIAALVAMIPVWSWLATLIVVFGVFVPVANFSYKLIAKCAVFVVAPRYTRDFTPFGDLKRLPRATAETFNFFISIFGVAVFAATSVVVQIINKLVWLVESLIDLPAELIRTKGAAGFKSNMSAWADSWRPSMFMEDSLGSVTVKKFKQEQEREAKAKAAKKDRLHVVKPNPATV